MENIASLIDHTLLDPLATLKQVEKHCWEGVRYRFHSVCVQPSYVRAAYKIVCNTPVEICSVAGFPLGANDIATKVFECLRVVEGGAHARECREYLDAKQPIQHRFYEGTQTSAWSRLRFSISTLNTLRTSASTSFY